MATSKFDIAKFINDTGDLGDATFRYRGTYVWSNKLNMPVQIMGFGVKQNQGIVVAYSGPTEDDNFIEREDPITECGLDFSFYPDYCITNYRDTAIKYCRSSATSYSRALNRAAALVFNLGHDTYAIRRTLPEKTGLNSATARKIFRPEYSSYIDGYRDIKREKRYAAALSNNYYLTGSAITGGIVLAHYILGEIGLCSLKQIGLASICSDLLPDIKELCNVNVVLLGDN